MVAKSVTTLKPRATIRFVGIYVKESNHSVGFLACQLFFVGSLRDGPIFRELKDLEADGVGARGTQDPKRRPHGWLVFWSWGSLSGPVGLKGKRNGNQVTLGSREGSNIDKNNNDNKKIKTAFDFGVP